MPAQFVYEKDSGNKEKYLVMKGVDVHKCALRMSMLSHPMVPVKFSATGDRVVMNWKSGAVVPALGLDAVDTSKVDTHFIPEIMSALRHAHSRMLIFGNVSFDTIGISGNHVVMADWSHSRLHAGNRVKYDGLVNEFSAPETHINGFVVPASDVYGLALWWMAAKLRSMPSTWGDSADPLAIQSAAMERASTLQQNMLHASHHKRFNIDVVTKQFISEATNQVETRRSELQVAYQAAISGPTSTFADLIKMASNERIHEFKFLVPSLLCVLASHCEADSGRGIKKFYGPYFKSALDLLVELLDLDTNLLSKVNQAECFNLKTLLLTFFAADFEKGVRVVHAFVVSKLFDVDDHFLVGCYECGPYESEMSKILGMSKNTAVARLLSTVMENMRSALEDKKQLMMMSAQIASSSSSYEAMMQEKDGELETLREQLKGYQSLMSLISERSAEITKRPRADDE